jgi:hypothetical protein
LVTSTAWQPTPEQRRIVRKFAEALEGGYAGLFAGAGLSRAAGFVDWRGLLKDIAEELNLDIDRENDLIAVAQYHVNEKKTRGRINQVLIDELTKSAVRTPAHSTLARLPFESVWTTNYDQLLERSFEEAGKVVDLKLTNANLAQTRRGRDVVIYKMHGCITMPEDAVVTKDDYESYAMKRALFSESLKGDLIGKTFLFLGFSFIDPNIDQVLGRVRTLLGMNQREHYCVMRRPPRPARLRGRQKAEFEYQRRKADLQQGDLLRFGIETLWIDEYAHLEPLLRSIAAYVDRKSVFVSGAARDPTPFGADRLDKLTRSLGARLIHEGFRLVSGFGYGLGEQCVVGALGQLYNSVKGADADRVLVKPFPRAHSKADQPTQNTRHREDLLSRVGAVVVVAGNKGEPGAPIQQSSGVLEEVSIALRLHKFIIPIGATGHVAHAVWQQAIKSPEKYLPGLDVLSALRTLGDVHATNETLLSATIDILSAAEKAVSTR